MLKKLIGLFTGIVLAGAAGTANATSIIDTVNSWDGSFSAGFFGEIGFATYGQTFTVTGPETQMQSFTFLLDDQEDRDVVDFQAFVYQWDAATFRPTGSALFSSGILSTALDADAGVFETFMIDVGGVTLIAGAQYVAFFSASQVFDGQEGHAFMAFHQTANPYAGGEFVNFNNGSDFAGLFAANWGRPFPDQDLAFIANFTTPTSGIPEPSSLALAGFGLAAFAAFGRRRKKG